MDAIAAVLAVSQTRQDVLAVDIGTSLTRKALDEMRIQAASVIDSVPPPPPMTTKGAFLDTYA